MLQKPAPHSISSRLDGTKAEKCGPKLIILANSFYAYQRRRRTSSTPSGKAPSSSTKFSPEERTAYVMRPITDSSRTHGTRPNSGDSTPSTELSVRLLTPSFLIMLHPLFPFSTFFPLHTKYLIQCGLPDQSSRTMCVSNTWGLPIRKLNINYFQGFFPVTHAFLFPCVPFLHHYTHRYDLRCGQDGLPGSCVYALRSR